MEIYNKGITRMEKTIDDVKELLNTHLKAMDIIEEPLSANAVKMAFEFINGYFELENQKLELLESIKNDTKEIENLRKEIGHLRDEIDRINNVQSKES